MPEGPLSTISEIDHRLYDLVQDTDRFIFEDGAIPAKYKILLAMAFDAARGANQGVKSLASRAMRAGASMEQIAEAIRVAYHLSGVGSVYAASIGLSEIAAQDKTMAQHEAQK